MAENVLLVALETQRSTSMESHRIVKAMEKVHQGRLMFTLLLGLKVRMVWNNYDYIILCSAILEFLPFQVRKQRTRTCLLLY